MPTPKGAFIWRELLTSDREAAKRFYGKVVGWAMQDLPQPGMTYTVLTVGGFGIGGVMDIPDEAAKAGLTPRWFGYIFVDDVDAMAKRVQDRGGSVHKQPTDIPGYGRFAVLTDPHGAMFNILAPTGEERTPPPTPTPGMPGWNELFSGDLDNAWSFYSGLFGWEKDQAIDLGPMGTYQLFSIGGVRSGGMMTKPPQMPVPQWLYYFSTDDVKAATERVKAAGGEVLMGPHQVPDDSWIVQCLDPQGAAFALVEARQ
jgi:predicted enzyme related to lactoylglutathione lyase